MSEDQRYKLDPEKVTRPSGGTRLLRLPNGSFWSLSCGHEMPRSQGETTRPTPRGKRWYCPTCGGLAEIIGYGETLEESEP